MLIVLSVGLAACASDVSPSPSSSPTPLATRHRPLQPGGTFGVTGSMSTPRGGATATLLADGRVLVVGGHNSESVLASAELFSPVTDSFRATGSMTMPRENHAASLLTDGRVLITGGGPSGDTNSAELYDPKTGPFTDPTALRSEGGRVGKRGE